MGVTAVAGWELPPAPARGRSGAGRSVPLRVSGFAVLADKIVDLLLAGFRRTEVDDVPAERLVVGRVFAVLAA